MIERIYTNRLRCRWGEFEATAEKAVFTPLLSPQEIICREGRTVAFETDFVPFADSQVIRKARCPGLGQPSYILLVLQWPHSFIPYRCAGYLRQELSRDTGGFLVPQEFPSGCPRNISQKANHMVTVQQLELKPPLEMHHTDFVSPGFLLWVHFFFFLFS